MDDFKANFAPRVMQETERRQKRNLSNLGGWIRLAAKRSIKSVGRRSTRGAAFLGNSGEIVSRPGYPPLNKTGYLREFLFAACEKDNVVIGVAKLNRKSAGVPEALEFGGKVIVNVGRGVKQHPEARHILPRPFMRPALARAQKRKIFEYFWKDSN